MSSKTVLSILVVLTVILALCEAANFCRLRISSKCKKPGRRQFKKADDTDDVMRTYDDLEKKGDIGYDFYPVIIPDDNLRKNDYNRHYSNVAKKDMDMEFYPSETVLQLLLRKYYQDQGRGSWQKRDVGM
ncbi:uncharacterized protein LOC144440178 [Glandiceps talaboti]